VVTELSRGTRIAPRILGRSGTVRATFVPTQAGPLAGDHDAVRITVGPGASLVVEPVAATLVLPGPARTLSEIWIEVGAGGRLSWEEAPFIVAGGADVERRTTVELKPGAVAALRETVVLGRAGEPLGAVDSSLRATLSSSPLLHDALRLDRRASADHRHVALPPGHRIASTAFLLGRRPRETGPRPGVMDLHRPGALTRVTGASLAAVEAAAAAAFRTWSLEALSGSGPEVEDTPGAGGLPEVERAVG